MKPISDYFGDPSWLNKALVHRSYCNEHPGTVSNERLEFLGDSVLSLIISSRLYQLLPSSPEGELTSRRSYVVQTTSLATKAQELGLDKIILLSHGEEESGGRQNTSLLANTFEAVLGALYLDRGLETCQDYLSQIFPDSYLTSDLQIKDPKSLLQEKSQSQGLGVPVYKTISSSGPDHAKNFVIAVFIDNQQISTGEGGSKQRAETASAAAALAKLFPS